MSRALSLLALFLAAAGADGDDSQPQPAEGGRTPFAGFRAEVEVRVGGVPRHGRVVVTRDGGVHLEHLDEQTRRWATEVIRQTYSVTAGWDARTDPVSLVWDQMGPAKIETANGSIRISKHRPLASR